VFNSTLTINNHEYNPLINDINRTVALCLILVERRLTVPTWHYTFDCEPNFTRFAATDALSGE